jgi:hypothetical protein
MGPECVPARIDRLDRLVLGLMQEKAIIGKGQDPLLYLERMSYLKALDAAVRGLESARVVLAKAQLRMTR